jgi:RES domain
MELTPPESLVRWTAAPRLVPSRYPVVGLLDRVASSADLDAVFELEGWTNDRISNELGLLHTIPESEWVAGTPMASVVMAAFSHPRPGGSRFSTEERGAWYAARTLTTAIAESVYHRTAELREVGGFVTRVELRVYLADFRAKFHDLRQASRAWIPFYDPLEYGSSQVLGRRLLEHGSNGLVYRSVRDASGECLVCFRPALVRNVRAGGHYEFRWDGGPEPLVRKL